MVDRPGSRRHPGEAGEDTTYDTKEEVAAMAGAFLQQHAIPTTDGDSK